jgi:hypothetical protein
MRIINFVSGVLWYLIFFFSTLEPSLIEQFSDAFLNLYSDFMETIGLTEYAIREQPSGVGKSKGKLKNFNLK